jgi:hypothetical protein
MLLGLLTIILYCALGEIAMCKLFPVLLLAISREERE